MESYLRSSTAVASPSMLSHHCLSCYCRLLADPAWASAWAGDVRSPPSEHIRAQGQSWLAGQQAAWGRCSPPPSRNAEFRIFRLKIARRRRLVERRSPGCSFGFGPYWFIEEL